MTLPSDTWPPPNPNQPRPARSKPHVLHPRHDPGLPPPGAAGVAPAGLGHHRPDPADPVPGAVRPAAEGPAGGLTGRGRQRVPLLRARLADPARAVRLHL